MNQVTVRGVSRELARRLRQLSESRKQSINATVLQLLEQGVGLDARRERLQRYTTWTQSDLEEFQESLRAQRTIDEKIWG